MKIHLPGVLLGTLVIAAFQKAANGHRLSGGRELHCDVNNIGFDFVEKDDKIQCTSQTVVARTFEKSGFFFRIFHPSTWFSRESHWELAIDNSVTIKITNIPINQICSEVELAVSMSRMPWGYTIDPLAIDWVRELVTEVTKRFMAECTKLLPTEKTDASTKASDPLEELLDLLQRACQAFNQATGDDKIRRAHQLKNICEELMAYMSESGSIEIMATKLTESAAILNVTSSGRTDFEKVAELLGAIFEVIKPFITT